MVNDHRVSHFYEVKGPFYSFPFVISDVHHLILGDWAESTMGAIELQELLFVDQHPVGSGWKLCDDNILPSLIVHDFYVFISAVDHLNVKFDVTIALKRVLRALGGASEIISLPSIWFWSVNFQIKVSICPQSHHCQLSPIFLKIVKCFVRIFVN